MIIYIIVCIILAIYLFNKLTCGRCASKVCLVGKTAIITGGNSGIGYQVELSLASRGCRVIIADKDDSSKSRDKIIDETKNPNVIAKQLDLSSFDSIRKFSKNVVETEPHIEILINNADVMKKSAPSRIIFTSSIAAFWTIIDPENLNPPPTYTYNPLLYSNSKLCLLMAAKALSRRLKGTGVTVNSLHPGAARTGIFFKAFKEDFSLYAPILGLITLFFGKTSEEAAQTRAQTTIHLACDKNVDSVTGTFFTDCLKCFQPYQTYDEGLCERVFENTKKLVKLEPSECVL